MSSGQGAAALLEQWEEVNFLLKWKVLVNPGAPKSLQMVTAAMKLKDSYSLEGKL